MRRVADEGHPNKVSWVITTQEEIGLRGAHTAADAVKPGFFLFDTSTIPNRKMVVFVEQTGGTQAAAAGRPGASYGGIPPVNLVVPVRYTHAHNGIMERQDFDQMVELVMPMIRKVDANEVKRIRDFAPEARCASWQDRRDKSELRLLCDH